MELIAATGFIECHLLCVEYSSVMCLYSVVTLQSLVENKLCYGLCMLMVSVERSVLDG